MVDGAVYELGAIDPEPRSGLPAEKQAEVLKIAESLKQRAESKRPRQSGRGL
jgi:hypothetical protein